MNNNLYRNAERFPPKLVRLLARKDGKAMTLQQIAAEAGLNIVQVTNTFEHPTWDEVTLSRLKRITRACRVDFTSRSEMNRIETYLRSKNHKPSFKYLAKTPEFKTYYLPMLIDWRKELSKIPNTLPLAIQKLLARLPAA